MQKITTLQLALAAWLLTTTPWVVADNTPVGPVWDNQIQDRALTILVGEVLESNLRVRAADAALAAAQARARGADRPLYNPELELDAEKADVNKVSIGLSQTIDWSDKREARAGVAAAEREAYAAELARVRQLLATDLLSSLINFHTQRELGLLSQQRTELTQQFLSLAVRRHQAGDLPQVELDLAQLAAIQARMQQARAATAKAEALQGLIALTGDARSAWPLLPDELPAPNRERLDIDTSLTQLPALRAQQARINAARATVRLKTRERRPDPTLALRGGREDSEDLIGLTLSIPLFVRNDFKAEVVASSEEAIGAERQLHDMVRQARARLVSTAESYRLTRDAWLEWRQAGAFSLQRQTEVLQRLWQAGELSTTDYLLQLTQSLDTHVSAVELRGDLWQAWVDWLAASGQVEAWLGLGSQPAPHAP